MKQISMSNPSKFFELQGNTQPATTSSPSYAYGGGGGVKITGWIQSSELQRRAAGDVDWLGRLRGTEREGWSVEDHSWVCSEGPAETGHGLRGAVVGWYLPVLVVDEEQTKSG